MLLSPSPTAASDPTTLLDRAQLSVAVEAAIRERVIEQFVQQRRYSTSISEHVGPLTDPRKAGMIEHKLLDIITIAVCAVICGADDWVKVELFGKAKYDWLKTSLALPHGIPSHDTFGRVFAALSGRELQGCFANWMQAMVRLGQGEVIAIDGKTLRRSYDRRSNKAAIHLVSAWAQANRVVLGQVKTEAKSNEITAIPE
jgi:predicted transposase YbfD/YdcC